MTCLRATCGPRIINLSITEERITFTMSPVSLEPLAVWLVTGEHFVYWCMQIEDVVYSLRLSLIKIIPEPGFDLGSTWEGFSVLTTRLHMLHTSHWVTVCVLLQLCTALGYLLYREY